MSEKTDTTLVGGKKANLFSQRFFSIEKIPVGGFKYVFDVEKQVIQFDDQAVIKIIMIGDPTMECK